MLAILRSRDLPVRRPSLEEPSVQGSRLGESEGIHAHLSLRPDRREVASARRFVADTLTRWQCDHDSDVAMLLVSELVTNAVVHAKTVVAVNLRCEGTRITVEVHDGSDRMPADFDVAPTASSGRGIHLVAAMADDWGVRATPGDGKVVWFTLTPE